MIVPKIAVHRLYDLISENTSLETKASTARWYAEMMIDLFFSVQAKKDLNETEFNKKSLGEKIKIIRDSTAEDIISSLLLIKDFGDKASHYNPDRTMMESDAKKAVKHALGLFDLIFINHFNTEKLNKTDNTAKIFSTLTPLIRFNVIKSLLDLNCLDDDYQRFLLHKYILVLIKIGKESKAKDLVKKLKKNKKINGANYRFWMGTISEIRNGIIKDELPIAKNIEDCRRNFDNVMSGISDEEKKSNKFLIHTIEVMLNQIEPSNLGNKIGDKVYSVDGFV